MTEEERAQATAYLRANRALWEALQIENGATLQARPLAQGEHNANYSFEHPESGRRYVLRLNYISQLSLCEQASYELSVLRAVEPSGRTPLGCYADDSHELHPRSALVMEQVSGQMLDFSSPTQLAEAACMLADVHSVVPSGGCGLLQPGDALLDLIAESQAMFATYRGSALENPQITAMVERLFSKALRMTRDSAPRPAECRHIISTEMVSAHFLMNADGAPGHIIDWEKGILGEATRDVAYFLAPTTTIWDTDFIFTPQQRAQFVEQYWRAVGGRFERGAFDERFDAYTMANCLRGVTYCAQAWVQYHDPAHPLKNAKTFEKLKVYLSQEFLELLASEYFYL